MIPLLVLAAVVAAVLVRPGDPGDPFCRRPRRGPNGGEEERIRERKKAERERREAEEAAQRKRRRAELARKKAEREADDACRRAVEEEAEKTTTPETRKLVARARALTGADHPGFWLRVLETYYEPYTDAELEEIVAACRAERERCARRPIRYPRWGSKDLVEVLARHALDVGVVLLRRRRSGG